ncbi:MAG: hypothetical protein VYB65_11180, partial [Myxococcota bacterium]|nr:hypothetical protein [Myxococcota bacterium]
DCVAGFICHQDYCLKLPARCNLDGVVQLGEECDDGNTIDGDGCSNQCLFARCGDGVVRLDLSSGELGNENCEPGVEPTIDYCSDGCLMGEPLRTIATSERLSCAVTQGVVRCWGGHDAGGGITPLGPFEVAIEASPIDLPILYSNTQSNTFLLYHRDARGLLRADGFRGSVSPVTPTPNVNRIIGHNALSADGFRPDLAACYVTSSGLVACRGSNHCGQVKPVRSGLQPLPEPAILLHPMIVRGLQAVRALAMSGGTTCAALEDGSVSCWGSITNWDPLVEDCVELRPVTPIEGVEGIVALTAHRFGYTGVTAESVTYSWGRDWEGEPLVEPVRRVLPETAVQLGASDDTECVLFESGRVGCWGASRGEGNRAGNTLRMLEGLEEVVEISDGRNTKHLCARRSDDEIWCWGNNTYGQLGDGSRDSSAAPVRVRGL